MKPPPESRRPFARAFLGPTELRFACALLVVLALATLATDRALGPPPERFPTSDYAVLELCVRLAAEGSQRLGPEARFHFQHPGPSFFYMAVPFYEWLGRGAGALGTAALAWNLIALLAFVRAASRLAPPAGALLATLLSLLLLETRGLGFLLSFWNANLPILPFAAALAASARLATGDGRALPLLALFASLAVQTHAVYLVPVTLVASAGLALFAWPALRGSLGVPTAERGAGVRATLAACAVLALLWSLPLWDELNGDYHNLGRMLSTGGQPRANPWPQALAASSRALLGFAGVRWEGGTPPLWSRPLAFALVLLSAFALASRAAMRRRAATAAIAVVTLAALGALVLTARVAPGALSFPYVLHWAPIVGLTAALVALAEALEAAPRLRAFALGWPGRATLAALALLLVVAQARGERGRAAQPREGASIRVEQAAREIGDRLDVLWRGFPVAARPRFLLRIGSGIERDAVLGLILALDKARLRFAVEPFGPYRLDGRLRPRGDERGELRLGEVPTTGAALVPLSSVDGLSASWASAAPASSGEP